MELKQSSSRIETCRPMSPISRRAVLRYALAAPNLIGGCTLVDDVIMRPGLIYARNIRNIAWSEDGTHLVGSDAPRSFIAVWDAQTGARIWRRNLQTATGSGPLAFVAGSSLIVSADPLGVLSPGSLIPLLDASSGQISNDLRQLTANKIPEAAPTSLVASSNGNILALALHKQDNVYIIRFGEPIEVTRIGPIVDGLGRTGSTIRYICLSPDSTLLAIGFSWGEAQVWDVGRNTCLSRIAVYGNTSLTGLSFAGSTTLVSCSDSIRSIPTHQIIKVPGYRWAPPKADFPEAVVRIWNAVTGDFMRSIQIPDNSGANSVTSTSSGELVACVSERKRLNIWRVADGVLVQSMQLPFVSVLDPDGDVRFSPDGGRIAAVASSSIFVERIA